MIQWKERLRAGGIHLCISAMVAALAGLLVFEIDALLKAAGRSVERTAYFPLVARRTVWTVFIDPATAEVVAFMPLDPF